MREIDRRDFFKLIPGAAWGIARLYFGLGLDNVFLPRKAEASSLLLAQYFPETKFWVRDEKGINFLSEFNRLGGIAIFGYPISRFFEKEGFLNQAFQRGILQWRPDFSQAVLRNIMDEFYRNDLDDWLLARGVPRHSPSDSSHPDIASFYSQTGGLDFWGFPTSNPERFGHFISQRFQRGVLQLWLDKVEGMPSSGTVVPVLVGEFARQLGLIPLAALQIEEPPQKEKVNLPPVVYNGDRTKPKIALTIDDAWFASQVSRTLEIARHEKVKMTFFPVGRMIAGQAAFWRQAVADGHEIGNHTFTHRRLTALFDEEIIQDVQAHQNILDEVLGFHYPVRFLRPPGGDGGYHGGDPRLVRIAQSLGLTLAMWSLDSDGATTFAHAGSESILNHVLSSARNGDIILFHFNGNDVGALPGIINYLKNRNIQLVTLSELFV